MLRSVTALLAVVLVAAACSAQPVSRATTGPQAGTPAAQATGPASVEPSTPATPPPTVAPTDAPPATTTPAPAPTTATTPPKPGSPTWTLLKQTRVKATRKILNRYKATWTEPDGAADQFVVYGVKGCLRESKQHDGDPCVVKGMPIPKGSLVKLGTAPGTAREMEVTYEEAEAGPGPYGAILMRAVNAAGKSIFTIVHTEDVCWLCTY